MSEDESRGTHKIKVVLLQVFNRHTAIRAISVRAQKALAKKVAVRYAWQDSARAAQPLQLE
jgi:hypothetical protein